MANYHGLEFRTALEARWAAFFDLAGWQWRYNPAAVDDWKPDFEVTFPCGHSECPDTHTLLIAVLATKDLDSVRGHPALQYTYQEHFTADAGALFGSEPAATTWDMSHGAGGGHFDVAFWVDDAAKLWAQAGAQVTAPTR
ncbi:hypothetical protein GHT07_18940 [Caenimonas koreensis DSM 17982]|uniref:Uncharacterized protein n=1 Tax=Caenimonas koreensis DSM 17982 TaxID=1121255 RepID=A0A844BD22_9BURK|nr:hypothetical protein [Caenimonas koreensis]MRD49357.1 hypothetical protein [Caenimonas koreensis DSM 17982]